MPPTFSPSPETFFVEEIPAYLPVGAGEHTFVWIEKRGLTTFDAVNRLARRLDVQARDVGYAGMKDKHATTRQWLSIPRVTPENAAASGDQTITIISAAQHGNKLRVGHLRGNRFEVVVQDPGTSNGDGGPVAQALIRLAAEGLPNRYGDQRFGARGDNVERGLAILRGEIRERDHRRRRMLLSAVQSAVFNQVLAAREAQGLLRIVVAGDVLQKTDSGGVFVTDDPAIDQERLQAGELVITGPMPGGWAREPPPGTPARTIEDEALSVVGATRELLAEASRDLPGTRRPLLVPVTIAEPCATRSSNDDDAVRLRFELPAGTYATVVLEALGVRVLPPARSGVEQPQDDEAAAPAVVP